MAPDKQHRAKPSGGGLSRAAACSMVDRVLIRHEAGVLAVNVMEHGPLNGLL
jgi:hypothetical protein